MLPGAPTVAAGLALTLLLGDLAGGCVSTSMSAAEVRVPVLLGPVPCIGCAADPRARSELPVTVIGGEARAFGVFIPVGRGVGWGKRTIWGSRPIGSSSGPPVATTFDSQTCVRTPGR